MNNLIAMSYEGPFADARSCFPATGQKHARREYCKGKRLFVATTPVGQRVVALVHLAKGIRKRSGFSKRPGRLRAFWMDVITGTLYQLKTGIAISSDELFLWDIHKDPEAVKNLINRKFKFGNV